MELDDHNVINFDVFHPGCDFGSFLQANISARHNALLGDPGSNCSIFFFSFFFFLALLRCISPTLISLEWCDRRLNSLAVVGRVRTQLTQSGLNIVSTFLG